MARLTQAFVLGAGLGTRLRPLTDDLPKPLVPIFQKPLITFAFDHLLDVGVRKFFVNTHHRPGCFADVFPESRYRACEIHFAHEPVLLETAGGIANIADLLGREPFIVYNGDILSDLPLDPLIDEHFRAGNVITLALRSGGGPQHIALESGRVIDIHNQLGTGAPEAFVFTGIYIVESAFLDRLERGAKKSVIPHFLQLIRDGEKLGGVIIDDGEWRDVGTPEAYLQLHRDLPGLQFPNFEVDDSGWRAVVHPTAEIEAGVELLGCTVLGAGAQIGRGTKLDDTIVWPGAQIASSSELLRCIVRTRQKAAGVLHDTIV